MSPLGMTIRHTYRSRQAYQGFLTSSYNATEGNEA